MLRCKWLFGLFLFFSNVVVYAAGFDAYDLCKENRGDFNLKSDYMPAIFHLDKLNNSGRNIEGTASLNGTTCQSYGDHRVAMALAVAGLLAEGETVIEGAECVSVSYPEFWEHLETVTKRDVLAG